MHEEQLALCVDKWHRFERHEQESVSVRDDVSRHNQQILTLEKGQALTMEDIKDIKESLVSIDKKVDDKFSELKIWILSSAIAGILVLAGECLYFGGYLKQVDINTDRLKIIEVLHPRMDPNTQKAN